jgi:predicted neutral ceramidase superfamily lipid hydrolase
MKEQKTFLEKIFDFLGKSSATVFFFTILLKVWTDDENQWILNRIWLSALIVFFASIILSVLCCYKSREAE